MPLYHVTVEFSYYAEADNESDAMDLAMNAADDFYLSDCAHATEITSSDHKPLDGWEPAGLIYGTYEDTTLARALSRLSPNAKISGPTPEPAQRTDVDGSGLAPC